MTGAPTRVPRLRGLTRDLRFVQSALAQRSKAADDRRSLRPDLRTLARIPDRSNQPPPRIGITILQVGVKADRRPCV